MGQVMYRSMCWSMYRSMSLSMSPPTSLEALRRMGLPRLLCAKVKGNKKEKHAASALRPSKGRSAAAARGAFLLCASTIPTHVYVFLYSVQIFGVRTPDSPTQPCPNCSRRGYPEGYPAQYLALQGALHSFRCPEGAGVPRPLPCPVPRVGAQGRQTLWMRQCFAPEPTAFLSR